MTTDPPRNSCSCEWCRIRRDLAAAQGDARGWQWARLWEHYLRFVLNAYRHVEKGERIHAIDIDETAELAGEQVEEFRAELNRQVAK